MCVSLKGIITQQESREILVTASVLITVVSVRNPWDGKWPLLWVGRVLGGSWSLWKEEQPGFLPGVWPLLGYLRPHPCVVWPTVVCFSRGFTPHPRSGRRTLFSHLSALCTLQAYSQLSKALSWHLFPTYRHKALFLLLLERPSLTLCVPFLCWLLFRASVTTKHPVSCLIFLSVLLTIVIHY